DGPTQGGLAIESEVWACAARSIVGQDDILELEIAAHVENGPALGGVEERQCSLGPVVTGFAANNGQVLEDHVCARSQLEGAVCERRGVDDRDARPLALDG